MPKNDGFIASISLNDAVGQHVNFIRWSVHGDWVQQVKYYCINFLLHIPCARKYVKNLLGKEKMLVTSIFSFSHNVIYLTEDKFYNFNLFRIVILVWTRLAPPEWLGGERV